MRRNSLLAAGMLSVVLATSACGAGTGATNSSAQSSGAAAAGVEASTGLDTSAEIGTSQRAAAEKAKAAAVAAKKAKADAKAKAAAKAKADAAAAKKAAAAKAPAAPQVPVAVPAPAAPTKAPALPAAPKPAPAPVVPASSSERIVHTAYTTAYTWYDNTPAGSTTISHPVLHKTAGGTGTYKDPITIAVGHSLATGKDVLDFPAGTRIYLPDVRRYFIVEDSCGDGDDPQGGPCHQGTNVNGTNSTVWIDMWIGGQSTTADGADNCASKVTSMRTAVFNPASNYVVAPGAGVIHDGKCDAGYGNTLLKN
ncbi:hypothetical protein [uncultured Arthrobacter sp.]|uniref:hypothetical protein n=1 Tax=uncultured Arthrobacter sp. TaxID=114050 RepID=UPI0032167529